MFFNIEIMSVNIENPFVPIQQGILSVDRRLTDIETMLIQLMNGSTILREQFDKITFDEAILYLREQGIPMKRSQLYKLTAEKKLPCERFGKRLVFSRQALNQWIESKLVKKLPENEVMTRHLAYEAGKKNK